MIFSQMKTDVDVFQNSNGSTLSVDNLNFRSYTGIEGKPYIKENFSKIAIDGYPKTLPELRYNAFEDEMEFIQNKSLNNVTKILDLKIKFIDENKNYIIKKYTIDNDTTIGYLVELIPSVENKYGLYKREKVQLVEYHNNVTNTYLQKKNPYFEAENPMFIISYNNQYTKFSKNKNELLKKLQQLNPSVNKEKIKNIIIKSNLKTENDFIEIIKTINK